MLAPCLDCLQSGKCDMEAEKSRLALFAWLRGLMVSCSLQSERRWRGIEGVR